MTSSPTPWTHPVDRNIIADLVERYLTKHPPTNPIEEFFPIANAAVAVYMAVNEFYDKAKAFAPKRLDFNFVRRGFDQLDLAEVLCVVEDNLGLERGTMNGNEFYKTPKVEKLLEMSFSLAKQV